MPAPARPRAARATDRATAPPQGGGRLYVVSDGRGQTGAAVLQAALVQFAGQPHEVVREGDVRTAARVMQIVAAAAAGNAVVFYTLVADETRLAMQQASVHHGVPVVDLLGPTLSALHDPFQRAPRAEPGLL
jgi:hypothetical protein